MLSTGNHFNINNGMKSSQMKICTVTFPAN